MRLSVLTLLATAALVICMPLTAQEPRPFEKVSLRTDQALDIFLDVIRESKRNKDWPRALKALEEIERFIKTNGNEYILPVSDSLYTGARAAAYRELVTFPREALDAWRISADRAVCDAIEDCKLSPDASMLEKVVARYPLSSFGAEALDLLGAIYLERGDFSRLLRMCAKARVYLPGLEPAMKARLDLLGIISLTGLSGIRPDKLIEQFNKEFVRVKLPLHGTPVPAKQVLETCLTAIKPPETELPALPGGIGVEFWNKQFAPPANMEQLVRAAKNSTFKTGITSEPAIADGRVLFSNGSRISALWAADGDELWSFDTDMEAPLSTFHNSYCRPAVNDGLVAASLGSCLYVLDLATGKKVWSAAPGKADGITRVFLSSPCISGGTVMVSAAAWGQEITCSLFAYNLYDGSLRWKRRIVTGFPTDTFRLGSQPGPPVAWGGAVYFLTNLGSAVCCDIETGAVIWLRKYTHGDSYLKENIIATSRRWSLTPPLVHRGVFIAAPQDSPFMFASDAVDGTLLWREPRAGLERLRFLGGATGKLVFAAGSVARAFHYRTGKTIWTAQLPVRASGPVAAFSNRLIVPCGQVLVQLDPAKGQPLGKFLLPGEPEAPQQIIAAKKALLLANPWELKYFRCYQNCLKTGSNLTGLFNRGKLQWRTGEFGRGIETLQQCFKQLSDEDPLKPAVIAELRLASLNAAGYSKGSARAKYLEETAKYSIVEEQSSLLLEAGKAYETEGLAIKALRVYREVLVNYQARNVSIRGRTVYADDYARVCEREILRKNPGLRREQENIAAKLLAGKAEIAGPPHLLSVIRAYPNSEAAAKAYIRLGEYCLKEKLLVSAELYLGEFVFRNPQSPYAAQARALLAETYLAKNDIPHAKELLNTLSGSETDITIEGNTLKAGNYARNKLAIPGLAKADIENSLLPPLSRLWQTTPCLAQSAPDILGTDAGGKILYALGSNLLDCRDTQTGALLARFDLSNPPLPAGARRTGVAVEDGAVILWGKRLLKVGTVENKQAWQWGATLSTPDKGPGTPTRDQPQMAKCSAGILVLWPQKRLTLFDVKTGNALWQHKSGRPIFALPVEIKGKLVLLYADGSAAVTLNAKTGLAAFKTKFKGPAQAASSIVKCGDHALILRGSRDLSCLGADGKILWDKKGGEFLTGILYLTPKNAVLIPRSGAERELKCINLSDGSEAWKYKIGKDRIVAQFADENNLYVVQKPQFGITTALAIDSATGKARWTWRQPQGGYAVVHQTPNHLICCVVDRLISRIHIIDKTRGVQEQTITLFAEMYESGFIRDGSLFFTTDRCAYRYGPVKHALAREQYVNILYRLDRTDSSSAELGRLAAKYARFQAFDNAAEALNEIIMADWKLPEPESRRLMERAGGFRYGFARPGSSAINAPRMAGPVKIDGILDDGWLPVMGIRRGLEGVFKVDRAAEEGGEWLSDNDLCATYHFAWDRENFYLAVDVRDSIIRPWNRDEKELWKGDFLLVALDPLGDGGWMARADDILLSMGLTLPRQNLTQEEREEEERNKPKGEYFVKRREDGSGLVYEAKIPWELFNENGTNIDSEKGPPEGFTFGLELVLLDDDTGGGTTKTLNLARGLLLGKRNALWRGFVPRKFATIKLKK